jgi:FdhD protein
MSVPIVEEVMVRLLMDGQVAVEWSCSPADLEALAVGHLYIEQHIAAAESVRLDINRTADDQAIEIRAHVDRKDVRERAMQPAALPVPDPEAFTQLFRAMFTAADARHPHGGMHVAAATDGVSIVAQVEDVGRHNTIDKISGVLLLAQRDPRAYGLLLSSRVSGLIASLIASKAQRAGFAWIASRSIPTTMAAQIARECTIPIIGRAASRDAHVYT